MIIPVFVFLAMVGSTRHLCTSVCDFCKRFSKVPVDAQLEEQPSKKEMHINDLHPLMLAMRLLLATTQQGLTSRLELRTQIYRIAS